MSNEVLVRLVSGVGEIEDVANRVAIWVAIRVIAIAADASATAATENNLPTCHERQWNQLKIYHKWGTKAARIHDFCSGEIRRPKILFYFNLIHFVYCLTSRAIYWCGIESYVPISPDVSFCFPPFSTSWRAIGHQVARFNLSGSVYL